MLCIAFMATTTQDLIDLLDLLDLEEIEMNHYRGVSPQEGWQKVYGGQVLAQALVAASRTVPHDRQAHSLHGYFLRPGDVSVPILYTVDRIRDGKSFTTRRVVAIQRGKAIFNMSISFQIPEDGLEHRTDAPRFRLPRSCRARSSCGRRGPISCRRRFAPPSRDSAPSRCGPSIPSVS